MTAPIALRPPARRTARILVTAGVTAAMAVGLATPAASATTTGGATVTVALADDPSQQFVASIDEPTQLVVSGSGFQSVQNGFGGIYVLFGTTDGTDAWAPSAGGVSGESYRYVADDADNPVGFQLFVPFPGSSTEAEGNGGILNPDGTWSAQMTVPGAVIEATDATGDALTLDCTTEQCGIITIGAHGVVNATNETFTPIEFVDLDAEDTTREQAPSATAPEEADERPTTAPDSSDASDASADAAAMWLWIGGSAAVVVIVVVLAMVLIRRRRTTSGN